MQRIENLWVYVEGVRDKKSLWIFVEGYVVNEIFMGFCHKACGGRKFCEFSL